MRLWEDNKFRSHKFVIPLSVVTFFIMELTLTCFMWLATSIILSVNGLSIRSLRLLIAVLVVCNRDTMMAE